MRLRLLLYTLIGLGIVGLAVALIFYIQRGAHMQLKGSVRLVRTVATDENSSVAIIDFRITNVADYPWIVRSVDVELTDQQGRFVPGQVVADADATRLFEYFPLLGQKYNETLIARTKIAPKQTLDRMIAARFEVPEKDLLSRRGFRIRIEEIDGAVSEVTEGSP